MSHSTNRGMTLSETKRCRSWTVQQKLEIVLAGAA